MITNEIITGYDYYLFVVFNYIIIFYFKTFILKKLCFSKMFWDEIIFINFN